MGDREVDSPQVEEVGDVFDRPVGNDRQNPEIVAVIEGLREFGCKSDEAALKEAGGKAFAVVADMTDRAQAERALDEALAGLGGIDVCVSIIGKATWDRAEDFSEADWQWTIQNNLTHVFYLFQGAGRRMIEQGTGGSLVALASVALGVGANTVVFSITNALVFRLPPVSFWAVIRPSLPTPYVKQRLGRHHADTTKCRHSTLLGPPVHSMSLPGGYKRYLEYRFGGLGKIRIAIFFA